MLERLLQGRQELLDRYATINNEVADAILLQKRVRRCLVSCSCVNTYTACVRSGIHVRTHVCLCVCVYARVRGSLSACRPPLQLSEVVFGLVLLCFGAWMEQSSHFKAGVGLRLCFRGGSVVWGRGCWRGCPRRKCTMWSGRAPLMSWSTWWIFHSSSPS